VPIPVDWQKRMKFDFLQYDGATTDPLVFGDPNWSKIGKTTPDGTMMLYADPLSVHQMKAMGMATPVELDLEPGGCPNQLNLEIPGLFPAAILGTAEFDVTEIDVTTLQLVGVAPVQISYEDVGGPSNGQLCDCPEEDPDGHMDLVLRFSIPELVSALGGTTVGEERMLVLTGNLPPEEPGGWAHPIVGNDCVVITTGCQWDLDSSGSVGVTDFLLLLGWWGPCAPGCTGDLDGDGMVGVTDFLLILDNWGPCP